MRAAIAITALLLLIPAAGIAQPADAPPLELPAGAAAELPAGDPRAEPAAAPPEGPAVTSPEVPAAVPVELPAVPLTPLEEAVGRVARSAFSRGVLTELYAARSWKPLWTDKAAARELVAAIRESERQGLDPKGYSLADIEPLVEAAPGDPGRDAMLSRAFVRLAFDLRFGRIPTSGFTAADVRTRKLAEGENAAVLAGAVEHGQVKKFLAGLQPSIALYQRLIAALERYRKMAAEGGWKSVPEGPSINPGGRDARVPAIRARLTAEGDLAAGAAGAKDHYDGDLVEAVQQFQKRHGLQGDGVIGRRTVEAMNVPVDRRVGQIRATLERTRQLMHDLPGRFVVVNIASFSAYLIDNGQPAWSTRIIVGKPLKETPVFRASIESFTINPEWHVPDSIVREELLPGLARDPLKLDKMKIRRVGESYVQKGGSHNALGRIKFNMPNDHAVYLHDTPSKSLFERRERALSHGCVRVEHPFELAALLLDEPGQDAAALEKASRSDKTSTRRLREPVPVLVTTWSVVASSDGRAEFLSDIYGQDDAVLSGLGG